MGENEYVLDYKKGVRKQKNTRNKMKDGRWHKNDEQHNASLDIRKRYSCIICTRTDFQHNCMSFATIHFGAGTLLHPANATNLIK